MPLLVITLIQALATAIALRYAIVYLVAWQAWRALFADGDAERLSARLDEAALARAAAIAMFLSLLGLISLARDAGAF